MKGAPKVEASEALAHCLLSFDYSAKESQNNKDHESVGWQSH